MDNEYEREMASLDEQIVDIRKRRAQREVDLDRLAQLRAHEGFEELLDRLGLDWGEVYDSFHEGDSERLAYKLLMQLLRGDK